MKTNTSWFNIFMQLNCLEKYFALEYEHVKNDYY